MANAPLPLDGCQQGAHHWRPTTTTGLARCQICGVSGYCPVCYLGIPPVAACVHACGRHQRSGHVRVTLAQLPEATAYCTTGLHRWVATTAIGAFQCAICGVEGYCFACCPHAPSDAMAAPCAIHRAQAEMRREQA